MIKHIVALIVLSILVVMGMMYAQQLLQALLSAHEWISEELMQVFSGGEAGNLARQLIALLSIPVFVGIIPAIIYWALKRKAFPYFMPLVWATWLVLTAVIVISFKG